LVLSPWFLPCSSLVSGSFAAGPAGVADVRHYSTLSYRQATHLRLGKTGILAGIWQELPARVLNF